MGFFLGKASTFLMIDGIRGRKQGLEDTNILFKDTALSRLYNTRAHLEINNDGVSTPYPGHMYLMRNYHHESSDGDSILMGTSSEKSRDKALYGFQTITDPSDTQKVNGVLKLPLLQQENGLIICAHHGDPNNKTELPRNDRGTKWTVEQYHEEFIQLNKFSGAFFTVLAHCVDATVKYPTSALTTLTSELVDVGERVYRRLNHKTDYTSSLSERTLPVRCYVEKTGRTTMLCVYEVHDTGLPIMFHCPPFMEQQTHENVVGTGRALPSEGILYNSSELPYEAEFADPATKTVTGQSSINTGYHASDNTNMSEITYVDDDEYVISLPRISIGERLVTASTVLAASGNGILAQPTELDRILINTIGPDLMERTDIAVELQDPTSTYVLYVIRQHLKTNKGNPAVVWTLRHSPTDTDYMYFKDNFSNFKLMNIYPSTPSAVPIVPTQLLAPRVTPVSLDIGSSQAAMAGAMALGAANDALSGMMKMYMFAQQMQQSKYFFDQGFINSKELMDKQQEFNMKYMEGKITAQQMADISKMEVGQTFNLETLQKQLENSLTLQQKDQEFKAMMAGKSMPGTGFVEATNAPSTSSEGKDDKPRPISSSDSWPHTDDSELPAYLLSSGAGTYAEPSGRDGGPTTDYPPTDASYPTRRDNMHASDLSSGTSLASADSFTSQSSMSIPYSHGAQWSADGGIDSDNISSTGTIASPSSQSSNWDNVQLPRAMREANESEKQDIPSTNSVSSA